MVFYFQSFAKRQNLPLNYTNLDELGQFWKILGSQKIIFIKLGGGHNRMILGAKNQKKNGKYPPLQLGPREYLGVPATFLGLERFSPPLS